MTLLHSLWSSLFDLPHPIPSPITRITFLPCLAGASSVLRTFSQILIGISLMIPDEQIIVMSNES